MNPINQQPIISSDALFNGFENGTLSTDFSDPIYEIYLQFRHADSYQPVNIVGECDQPEILGDEIQSESSYSTSIDAETAVQAIVQELRRSTHSFSYPSNSADAMDPIRADVRFHEERQLVDIGAITDHNELVNNSDRDHSFVTLSESVDISAPTHLFLVSHRINIKYDLEETYRGRYKSDYFGMNGKNRKPRYVADREGNHFITLEVIVLNDCCFFF